MKEEIKQQWIAALRSGQYVQGRGVLHEVPAEGPPKFCVLGVLCDLVREELEITWTPFRPGSIIMALGDINAIHLICEKAEILNRAIPREIVDQVLSRSFSTVYLGKYFSLTTLNDHGCNFDQLARMIELTPSEQL